ncbi:hypothetical protein EBQ81_05630 [bacterium]|nr:hypothetical protein [bacterium]
MSYIITGARLLTYNHQNIFLSDAFRLNSIKNYTVEGFFLQQTNTQGVSGNIALESGLVRSLNEREDIIVNGLNLGPARITSISFDRNNPVRLDSYTISFNVLTSGSNDLYNLTGNLYTGISGSLSGTTSLLEAFDENFAFNINDDDSYNYSHNLNIRYRKTSGYASPIQLAKNLASGIFAALPNLGFIDSKYSGFYNKTGKKYFTENYNLITNDCSFTKNFNLFNNYSGDYTLTLTQSLNLGNDGNIEVTEEGSIKGLKEPRFFIASGAVETELAKSYSRCTGLINTYGIISNLGSYYPLFSTGIETSRNFNTFNGTAEYSVRYTNNPIFTISGYTREATLTLNKSNLNIVDVQENGSIRYYGNKDKNFATNYSKFSDLTGIFNSASGKIYTFYGEVGSNNPLYLIEKTMSFPNNGQTINYSIKFNDDFIYNTNITGIKKMSIRKSDTSPIHKYNEYIIPNKTVFSFAGGQTELGKRDLNLECVVARPNGNIFTTNPLTNDILDALKAKAVNELAVDFPNLPVQEAYITKCDYNFNSDLNLSFNVGIDYTSFIEKFNQDVKTV